MRAAVVLVLVFASTQSSASPHHRAEPAPPAVVEPPAPRTPGPDDAATVAVLEKIVAGPDSGARQAAIDELAKHAPTAIDAIGEWLVRPHQVTVADRRKVLAAIKAIVPDKNGRFVQPPRQTAKEQQAADDLDWLAALLALDPVTPGVGEVIADIAAIHALTATKDVRAAKPIFDAAFVDDTMIYRDECGRYLRKLEPYSIPALTKESQGKTDRKMYATYQLERLDRQEPTKALASATGDETVTIAILDVFRATHHREAVHAVWSLVNADSSRIRAAARAAWMDYITGPPPPPAPMAKLKLAGGKETKKAKPLWLTYRELADNELRKSANELLHESYPLDDPSLDDYDHNSKTVKVDLEDLTKRLWAFDDSERTKQETSQWVAAKAKADAGDLATATTMVDQMLAQNPDRADRTAMASLYVAWGKQLEGKQQWDAAAAAYSKAVGLDPKGPAANDALAANHYMLGKSLEAKGKDGGPDFRRAVALKPDYAPAKTAAQTAAGPAAHPIWMLYAGATAALIAMALFAVGMVRRRA